MQAVWPSFLQANGLLGSQSRSFSALHKTCSRKTGLTMSAAPLIGPPPQPHRCRFVAGRKVAFYYARHLTCVMCRRFHPPR